MIAKCQKQWLKYENFVSYIPQICKSRIKAPVDSMAGDGAVPRQLPCNYNST